METTGTGIQISEASMEATATTIKQAADEMKTLIEKIETEIRKIEGAWTDTEGQKYIQSFRELSQSFPGFYNQTYAFGNFISGVVKAYQNNVHNFTSKAVEGVTVDA